MPSNTSNLLDAMWVPMTIMTVPDDGCMIREVAPIDQNTYCLIPIRRGVTAMSALLDLLADGRKETGEEAYICGGFARWCASPVRNPIAPEDVDVFCSGGHIFEWVRAKLHSLVRFERETAWASTTRMAGEGHIFEYLPPIQLIKPKPGLFSRTGVLNRFDFSVCRVSVLDSKFALACTSFISDERSRTLRMLKCGLPWKQLFRLIKYSKKGYNVNPVDFYNLFLVWEDIPEKKKILKVYAKLKDGKKLTAKEREFLDASSDRCW